MDIFRIAADLCHMSSKLILITAIHINRSAEGVSLITQALYTLVFLTRYADLLWVNPFHAVWNTTFKIIYIVTSIYIQYLMIRIFPRSHEREKSFKIGGACLVISVALLWPIGKLFITEDNYAEYHPDHYWFWVFSIILESFCILPQLYLLRQTNIPTVIDSYYLGTLGIYRAFYLVHWIFSAAKGEKVNKLQVLFGVIQTIFYLDFAWVYYTRQRVKLRGGGIVDSDDLQRGWIIRRIFGNGRQSMDHSAPEGEEEHDQNWGARGISVSADEDIERHGDGGIPERTVKTDYRDGNGKVPESQPILESDDEDIDLDEDDILPPANGKHNGVSGGEEWRA